MSKKFIFNTESLEFEIKKTSLKSALKKIFTHSFLSITIGALFGYFLFTNFKTFETSKLEKKNSELVWTIQFIGDKITSQQTRIASLENFDDNIYRSVLGLKPISKSTRLLGTGGTVEHNNLNFLDNSQYIAGLLNQSNALRNRIKLEAESYSSLLFNVKERDKRSSSIPHITPLSKKDLEKIGSGFGIRIHPIFRVPMMHTGVDLSAQYGKPIYATGDGVVIRTEYSTGGYGLSVRIDHGYSYQTLYAHMSKILVSPGQTVKRGQLIGLVGNSGRSTAPHLHYEVRINGKPVNPVNFFYDDLSDEEYKSIISNASASTSMEEL